MAKFVPGTDDSIKSDEPLLDVLASAATPLKPGKHVFQLVVVDDSGNDSAPASVTIIIEDRDRPTAVVDLIDERGGRIPEPEVRVPFGRPFQLTGDRSSAFFYGALHRAGLASRPTSLARDDGLELLDARIANAVRCAPPGNRPEKDEIANCLPYLVRESALLTRVRPSPGALTATRGSGRRWTRWC